MAAGDLAVTERRAEGGLSRATEDGIRAVLDGRPGGRARFLLFAGPAVTASIAYMDPGNFATNIQAGARYGYSLLWVVLAANLTAMLFQALSARLGIVTGRHLAEHFRGALPRSGRLAAWGVSEVAAMATDLAEFLGGAIGLSLLTGMPLMAGMGITVAPMIPTAMVRASASGILGVTRPFAAAPQATGAISSSTA